MPQQPFTPTGVSAKSTELIGLSASNRAIQANLITSDYVSWMNDNFTLSTSQQTYLSGMDAVFIDYAAYMTSFAVLHGRPISRTVTTNNGFKLVHMKNDIEVTNSGSSATVAGGIQYEIEYL